MLGASDPLRAVMSDIVDKAQQLAKNKIATLLTVANQLTGPPTIATNPPVVPVQPMMADDKPTRKQRLAAIQQYPDWDTREYSDSKSRRKVCMDAREKQQEERQMESAKRDMLVYKQMIFELKAVLATKKDKKVRKALQEEIHANKDIIKTLIWLGVPDIPLPKDIELQIMVERNKKPGQQGSKSPQT